MDVFVVGLGLAMWDAELLAATILMSLPNVSQQVDYTQSRTGGVLGAMQSAAVMGTRMIFSRAGGIQRCKKLKTF